MKGLLIFLYLVVFIGSGIMTYQNRQSVVVKSFTITEMDKDNTNLVYVEKGIHKTYNVEAEEFIKYEVGDKYKITQTTTAFKVYAIILIICIIILFIMMGSTDGFDLGDILDALT